MPIELPDARQLSDEELQVLCLRALRGLEPGFPEVALAGLLGTRPETISRWWTACRIDGFYFFNVWISQALLEGQANYSLSPKPNKLVSTETRPPRAYSGRKALGDGYI
jgi:hypothetical protein